MLLQDLQEGPWSQNNIDNGAEMMIPVPKAMGGVIVLGEAMITYFGIGAHPHRTIAVQETTFRVGDGKCVSFVSFVDCTPSGTANLWYGVWLPSHIIIWS